MLQLLVERCTVALHAGDVPCPAAPSSSVVPGLFTAGTRVISLVILPASIMSSRPAHSLTSPGSSPYIEKLEYLGLATKAITVVTWTFLRL